MGVIVNLWEINDVVSVIVNYFVTGIGRVRAIGSFWKLLCLLLLFCFACFRGIVRSLGRCFGTVSSGRCFSHCGLKTENLSYAAGSLFDAYCEGGQQADCFRNLLDD